MKLGKFKLIFMVGIIFYSISISAKKVVTPFIISAINNIDVSSKINDSTTYPILLTTFTNSSPEVIKFKNSYKRDAYIDQNVGKAIYYRKFNEAYIWKFAGNDSFGFAFKIQPTYIKNSKDNKSVSLKDGYMRNTGTFYYDKNNPYDGSRDLSFEFISVGGTFNVEIYALKKPTTGVFEIPETNIATIGTTAGDLSEFGDDIPIILSTGNIIVKPKTCEITNKNIIINMEKVILKDFSNKNEIYGGENKFNLKCADDFNRTIFVSMKDVNNGTSSEYSLKSTGTASGFGVSLYHEEKKIKFSPNQGSANEFKLIKKDGGYSIPLQAYYVKEVQNASAGTVNSLAQLTLRYE